jgi:hypothetical protein
MYGKHENNCTHEYAKSNKQMPSEETQVYKGRQENAMTAISSEIQMRWRSLYPTIHWQGCQAEQVVLNLSIHGRRIKPKTTLLHSTVHELNELLRCLFSQAKTILVEPLPQGYSNTRIIKIQPFYTEGGAGRHVVVKFGDSQIIEQEYENYRKYGQPFIGDGRSTTILDYQRTAHMGGIVYSFLGTATQQMQSFGTFYSQAPIDDIRQALDLLFRSTCRIWYANCSLQFLNLTEDYQKQSSYTLSNLKRILGARLPTVLNQEELLFESLHSQPTHPFRNPFYTLKTLEPQIYPTYTSITHGDFNQGNIFMDQNGYSWLIDFQSTGPSHILRDVATLDAVIRLQLLTPEQATLDERLALEEALCRITHFNQLEQLKKSYFTANPALTKIWETIVHLRMIAHWLIEKMPSDEMREYYAALLYVTMNTLSFSSLAVEQCEHALISACLLIDRLCNHPLTLPLG